MHATGTFSSPSLWDAIEATASFGIAYERPGPIEELDSSEAPVFLLLADV